MSAVVRAAKARSRSRRIGVLMVLCAALVLAFALTAQNGMPGYVPGFGKKEVVAEFSEVGALRAGDEVRIADVRSGFVSEIKLVDGKPVVRMELDGGREVYADATATIDARSALGQKYVSLDPGTAKAGDLEDAISLEQTDEPVELDDVLNTLDPQTRASTQTTLREVGGGLTGRGADLKAGLREVDGMLVDLAAVSEALAADDGSNLEGTLRAASLLSSSLAGQRKELEDLTADLATTLDAIGVDNRDPLAQALTKAPATLRDLRSALATLDSPLQNTTKAVTALRPGADALSAALPDTRGLLRDSVEPLKKVPAVSTDADKAVTATTPVLTDARPVVRQLGTAVVRALDPLTYMAPYGAELEMFWRNFASTVALRDGDLGALRVHAIINPELVTGIVPVRSPLTRRDPYPAPGDAYLHGSR